MSSLSSISGAAGNQWQWALMNRSSVGAGASMPVPDADGDNDGSMPPAATGSASGGTSSPLSLLTGDLQSLLTTLQDIGSGNTSGTLPSNATTGNGPASQLFAKIDSNGDGSISQSEWEAGAPQGVTTAQADQKFASLDTNGDGSISPTELQTGLAHRGHHGHGHHASAPTDNSTAKVNDDIANLLQDMQGMTSGTSTDGLLTASTGSGSAGSGNVLNDQLTKMLADLQQYMQSQTTSTVQVSA